MKEIVKIGYKKIKFIHLDWVFDRDFNYDVSVDKEKLRERVKEEYIFYYVKSDLLKGPINSGNYIDCDEVKKDCYKIVTIPQEELEMIMLKNRLCGCITMYVVQEKEFDKIFDELYPKLIEKVKQREHII